jgi:diguanylate cyclase (GGDEF)-like protein/PAS domain S-box-containing protein
LRPYATVVLEFVLTEQNAVPLIVVSSARDPVEAINSILRRAGHPVHCTWIASLRDLGEAIGKFNPELLIHVSGAHEELQSVVTIRDQTSSTVPVVVLADAVDEARIAAAMTVGARDVVTLANPVRLQAVMMRELRAHRLERALNTTLKSAHDARSQLETVLERSNDAIVQIQEGIVVDANPAWVELFGVEEGLLGHPVMDLFDETTQPALRGALAACLQGRWNDHTLRVNAILSDGSKLPVEVVLALGEHEGEPSIRLVLPSKPRDDTKLVEELSDVVRSDPTTGLLRRRELIEALNTRFASAAAGGMRCIAFIKLDKFSTIERDVGVTASDDVLTEFAKLLKESLYPKELAGRFGGVRFLVLLERGNEHDIEAWGEQLIARVQKHVMRIKDKTVSLTCTVGLSVVPANAGIDAVVADAIEACRKGIGRGGNQTVTSDRADNDNRVQSYDKIWVKHIKAALMENRFRLVQQPVASLQGDDPVMFDVLVRMVDTQNKEVLPAEFMAAAERNDLLKNIDRWVVGASLSFAAQRKPGCLFVRLSKDTAKDGSFLEWLENHVRSSRAEPQRLCFQVTEEVAASYLVQVKALATALRQKGFRFALDGFGSGRDSQGLLDTVPLDFVKIDGALVQGLTGDPQLQLRVRTLVESATKRLIQTIGERVEDANTMAVLWQIGVQYIQGYFVNEPEQVVMKADGR